MDPRQTITVIVMAAVFGLVFCIWCICVLLWFGQTLARSRFARNRLGIAREETGEAQTSQLWRDKKQEQAGVTSRKTVTLQERLETLRTVTGWRTPAHMVLFGVGAASLLGFLLVFAAGGSTMLAVGVAAAVVILFWRYVLVCTSKYHVLLDMQFIDGLGICARALRAGLPLLGSFQLISEEIDKPIGDIFDRICREQMMGKDFGASIKKVAETVPSPEFKLFATSIAIQLQSGGNLADLMDSLASVVRSRIRLNKRIRVLTAQAQLSKKILSGLPVFMLIMLTFLNPEYMSTFWTTTIGTYMLVVMVVMILIGTWIMGKLAVIKF